MVEVMTPQWFQLLSLAGHHKVFIGGSQLFQSVIYQGSI